MPTKRPTSSAKRTPAKANGREANTPRGEIVAAGNGKKTEDGKVLPLDVKVGDLVLFGKYAGTEIKVDNDDFLMMREDDILAVVE